jgi:class 3 adenylate cyclase
VTVAVSAVAAAEFVAVVVLGILLGRSRRAARRLQAVRDREARPVPRTAAGRAVKAAVETAVGTAVRMRTEGLGGFLMSSLEDLSRWATEDRAAIAQVAAPDGTVTIVFSDIEDSTALNERLGDARWVRVLDAHDALVRRQVQRSGGHVVKSQGDGFMIVFGDPAAAADAALGIQQAVGLHAPVRLRRTPIRIRIGMHVGKVVAREGDYFGRNVALAARVDHAARGGEVLVSDDVRAALGDEHAYRLVPRGELELKGLSGTHRLWELQPA